MTRDLSTARRAFAERLAARPLLVDGAMGTVMYGRGVFLNVCYDELSLRQPELVRDIHRDYVFRRYAFFSRFTAGTYSYEAKASKPGREIYEIAQRQLALDPASTFFIDDLLPNIETARTLGFQAHHYHYDQHDALLLQLAAAGVA